MRHYLESKGNICWLRSSNLASLWSGLFGGLSWAANHIEPSDGSSRQSYMRRASLACLLAVHVSGWFARPEDNHRGWKQAYETFALSRDMQSAFFLFNRKLVLTVLNYVTTRQCLQEGIVEMLLGVSFKPPQGSRTVPAQMLARNRRIQVDLPVRTLATPLLSIPTEQQSTCVGHPNEHPFQLRK
ncbi:uncharacterized protein BYT42DRAFT_41476 [Radiomyces spectabilis]|uniref:uncharacterized protein n=1 Tax=Radiomyces spectabilis TaxID=64574 RepID=UPI00221FDF84|nr:uncharacterized protein BYT42DRAFT_41476 [Radiomyces spectabilis]KAI8394343.1 hypothetical protein BYT42DRAFT_41476 [Radiomyces spectabilis]